MNEQPPPESGPPRQEIPDALSWQYIVLIVIIAFLIPIIVAAPIPIARGGVFVPFDQLRLTEHYDDPGGISLDYPEGWSIASSQPGDVQLTNRSPGNPSAQPPIRAEIRVQIVPREQITFTDGSVPDSGSSAFEVMAKLVESLEEDSPTLTEVVIDSWSGASIHQVRQGLETELMLLTVDDDTYLAIRGTTNEGKWENFSSLFSRVLDTIALQPAAG